MKFHRAITSFTSAVVAISTLRCGAPAAAQPFDNPCPAEDPVYNPDVDQPIQVFYLAPPPWGLSYITWETCTMATPFATLDQARAQVRRYTSSHTARPVLVRIAGGLYPVTNPVVFTSEDSGWAGLSIQYVAWNPGGLMGNSSDDVLFSGGVELTTWTPTCVNNGVAVRRYTVPTEITDVRDVWVNNRRMIRARFPSSADCTNAYFDPYTSPCPNLGWLLVKNVQAVILNVNDPDHTEYQRVSVHTADGVTPIPVPTDWSHVEVVATRKWFTAQQRVHGNFANSDPRVAILDFGPISHWDTGHLWDPIQDLGALGAFNWNDWHQPDPNDRYVRAYLEMSGEDNVCNPGQDCRYVPGDGSIPTQAYLTNDLAFLDADKEWYFDPANHWLYIKIPGDTTTCSTPGACNVSVVVPRVTVPQLLVLKQAQHLLFRGLDWAYTYQPMPTMTDHVTPGYVTSGNGRSWTDATNPYENILASGAITMLGAQDCKVVRCRIGHSGCSGVVVTTDTSIPVVNEPPPESTAAAPAPDPEAPAPAPAPSPVIYAVESNNCWVQACEIFDLGGHGVYVGDEFGELDSDWRSPATSSASTHDPSNGNCVLACQIQTLGTSFRDADGICLAHVRDSQVLDNEVARCKYSGINIGSVGEHSIFPVPPPCGTHNTAYYSQNTEGTRIVRNHIHNVMQILTDGGGIYTVGSHLPSSVSGATAQIDSNYIHDIYLDPLLNRFTAPSGASRLISGPKAMYFDLGTDGWHILRNYVANAAQLFEFDAGTPRWVAYSTACEHTPPLSEDGPALLSLPNVADPAHWCDPAQWQWAWAAWPTAWAQYCDEGSPAYQYHFPGQVWHTGSPNYWLNPPQPLYGACCLGNNNCLSITEADCIQRVGPGHWFAGQSCAGLNCAQTGAGIGPFDKYEVCYGHYGYVDGVPSGMVTLTGGTGYANRLISDPNDPAIGPIVTYAGPYPEVTNWFFPDVVHQIHRSVICGTADSPEPDPSKP